MSSANTPAGFESLPLDLLPLILSHLSKRQDLRSCTLVSRTFSHYATPALYSWVRMFGKDLTVVPSLFAVLASTPRLALLVKKLEVRVFPKSMKLVERQEMEELAVRVLRACLSVEELVWTRIGSLSDDTMDALTALPNLRHFELNGEQDVKPVSAILSHH